MYVYIMGAHNLRGDLKAVKIGVTDNIEQRIAHLQTAQILEIKLAAAWHTKSRKQAFFVEREMHLRYEKACMRSEWFRPHIMRSAIYRLSEMLRKRPFALDGASCAEYVQAAKAKKAA
jgi:hypothetical protein